MADSPHYVWELKNGVVALDIANSKNVDSDDKRNFFNFELIRKVYSDYKETLIIKAFYKKESYGEIVTNVQDIQQDISQLKQFGVALNRTDFIDIAKVIELGYLELLRNVETPEVINIDEIFTAICEYILDSEIPEDIIKSIRLYHIPVDEFTDFIVNNDKFRHLDCTQVKMDLSKKSYTKCNAGRTDNTVSIKSADKLGKRIKVISFFADDVDKMNKSK